MRGLFLLLGLSYCAAGHTLEHSIEGVWLNEKRDGYIEISSLGETYKGTVVGSPNEQKGVDRTERHNEDPALRGRLLLGLVIIDELVRERDNRWGGGWIYDPDAGKTYRCRLTLSDKDTLEVRGYIGAPTFGRSQTWKRKPEDDT